MKMYISNLFPHRGGAARTAWACLGGASTRSQVLPALIAALGLITAGRVTAQTFTTLHSFTGGSDGACPYAGLILSGNSLYGTAEAGGSSGNGTVFSLSFRPQLTITPSGTNVILSWPTNVAGFDYTGYTLQSAPALTGTFTNLPAEASPYTNPISDPQTFFRLISN